MSQKTSIEWTDATWNPVRGCSRISEGCRNCYAERMAARFAGSAGHALERFDGFHGFAIMTDSGPRWTGRVELIESKLSEPLHWRKPRRAFVNSMSDLFHEDLPDEAIDRVFAAMALCPQHTFQVLTKRADRMRKYLCSGDRHTPVIDAMNALGVVSERIAALRWPVPNVWLGVSVENQETADARIPLLLQTPAGTRFVSYEPAIGPVDWDAIPITVAPGFFGSPLGWHHRGHCHEVEGIQYPTLDWVIVGGESGPGARPFDTQWARNTIAQCKTSRVACFVKQLGAFPCEYHESGTSKGGSHRPVELKDRKGGHWAEWSEDLRVREFPEVRA